MTATQSPAIRFESVRVRDIHQFACRAAERTTVGSILPVSRQRALAWSMNPYADGDDVALHVAYAGTQCVGYQGMMPGRLRVDGTLHKVLWTSTLFVDPAFRKYQVALGLNTLAVSSGNDCLAIGPSVEAQAFLRLLRWRIMRPAIVIELRFADDHRVTRLPRALWSRVPDASALSSMRGLGERGMDWFDRRAYPLTKALYGPRIAAAQRQLAGDAPWSVVPNFEASDGIEARVPSGDPGFVRGREAINWMLQYPWLIERGQQPDDSLTYRFSNVRDVFRYVPVRLGRPGGTADGIAVFSVSRRHGRTTLKLFDAGPRSEGVHARVAGVALALARQWSADVVELPPAIADVLQTFTWARPLMRTRELHCFGWTRGSESPLGRTLAQLDPGPADGDLAFT